MGHIFRMMVEYLELIRLIGKIMKLKLSICFYELNCLAPGIV